MMVFGLIDAINKCKFEIRDEIYDVGLPKVVLGVDSTMRNTAIFGYCELLGLFVLVGLRWQSGFWK